MGGRQDAPIRVMSNKCIYCGWEGKLSGEHYLPRCLGKFRGYAQLRGRICQDCNNSFSVLDEQFCRSGPEAILRERLNVQGYKQHTRRSPFQRGSAGAKPVELKGTDGAGNSEVDFYYHRQTGVARRRRQIIFFETNVGQVSIQVTDDMTGPDQLEAELRRAGVRKATSLLQIVCAPDEWEWMLRLLSRYEGAMIGEPIVRATSPGWLTEVHADARPTHLYFRGLAKIGFHYFLKHMPEFHGSEDYFAGIRQFITQGRAEDVYRFTEGWVNHLLVDDLQARPSPVGYYHSLEAVADRDRLISRLRFFIGPGVLLPSYTIHLGDSPLLIDFKRASAHSYRYCDDYRKDGYDGEMLG